MTNLEWALKYTSIGWHVIPLWWIENGKCACGSADCVKKNTQGKHPIWHCVPNGLKQATIDKEEVSKWFKKFPKANIAVVTGKISGITALDVDARHGGFESIKSFEVPITVQARSGSGSSHFIFKYNEEVANTQGSTGIAPGIDTKNDNGYLILEPSNHLSGGHYEWISDQSPFEYSFNECPEWMKKKNIPKVSKKQKEPEKKEKIPDGERNSTLTKLAGSMHRKGLSENAIFAAIMQHNKELCDPQLSEEEVKKIAKSVTRYTRPTNSDVEFDKFFNPKKTTRNAVVFLEQKYGKDIWWNDFVGCEYLDNSPISDITITQTSEWLMFDKGIEIPESAVDKAIRILALRTRRNPVKEYLSSLTWDGVKRVERLFQDYMGVPDGIMAERIGGLLLVSAVARVFEPGCKYDHMVILMSRQGMGKQRLLETLAGEWYGSVRFKDRDKETVQKMLGKWFIEVGEMRGMGTKEINDIKDFVTTRTDRERFAYGRKLGEYPRTNIFIGSWNPDHVGLLNDPTGYRRFLPIEIGKVNIDGIRLIRDQLFAEALYMYNNKYRIYLDDDLDSEFLKELDKVQKKVEVKEEWANHIKTFMLSSRASDMPDEVTILDIFLKIFPNKTAFDLTMTDSRRIGNALAQLGIECTGTKTINYVTAKYFNIAVLRGKSGDSKAYSDILEEIITEKTGLSKIDILLKVDEIRRKMKEEDKITWSE